MEKKKGGLLKESLNSYMIFFAKMHGPWRAFKQGYMVITF